MVKHMESPQLHLKTWCHQVTINKSMTFQKKEKNRLRLAKGVDGLGNTRKNPEILAYLIGSWPGAPQVYIINNDVSHLSSFCCLASYHPPGVADNSSLKKPRRFFAGFINHPLIVFSTLSPQSRQQQQQQAMPYVSPFVNIPNPQVKYTQVLKFQL